MELVLLSIAIIDIDLIPPGAGPETLSFALRATRRASGPRLRVFWIPGFLIPGLELDDTRRMKEEE